MGCGQMRMPPEAMVTMVNCVVVHFFFALERLRFS